MDAKVIGRIMNRVTPKPQREKVRRIVVRDLTSGSEGNACGIGLADFTTERLVAKIDRNVTRINSVLGGCPEKGRIPIAFSTDREAVVAALNNAGVHWPTEARVVWVKNTLELRYLSISQALRGEVKANERLTRHRGPVPFPFDGDGNLLFGRVMP